MSERTTEGWRLIWHGSEEYPYPLSVVSEDGGRWIARDGFVSSEANARMIAAASEMFEALRSLENDEGTCYALAISRLGKASNIGPLRSVWRSVRIQ